MTRSDEDITGLLEKWGAGDDGALDRVLPLVYEQLRSVAAAQMSGERSEHTLQPTALVHEAYARLVRSAPANCQNRAHFFAIAARVMRRVLVDHGRTRSRHKRGGTAVRITLTGDLADEPCSATDLVALDLALTKLGQENKRELDVVELRYFGGLTVSETASWLNVSEATVKRDWLMARAWLYRELTGK